MQKRRLYALCGRIVVARIGWLVRWDQLGYGGPHLGMDANTGEIVATALMMGMDDVILDRIAFGGVKELQELSTE
jgi:hypothetical protein